MIHSPFALLTLTSSLHALARVASLVGGQLPVLTYLIAADEDVPTRRMSVHPITGRS
jgi:hypothetical protein